MEDAERNEVGGFQMGNVIGQHILGNVICRKCGEDVVSAIGDNGSSVPLLHILETGKSCPGVGQMQKAPVVQAQAPLVELSFQGARHTGFRERLPEFA